MSERWKFRIVSPVIILICFVSVTSANARSTGVPFERIPFDLSRVKIEGDLKSFTPAWETQIIEDGLQVFILTLRSPRPDVPAPITVAWNFPSLDISAFWNSDIHPDKVNYYKSSITSRASSQAPVITLMNIADINRFTFACSDALNKVSLGCYLREEDARFYCSLKFFDEMTPAMTEYRVKIRIDTRNIPFYAALRDVTDWWAAQENYTPAPVPEHARLPMYSTWYSFHQNLDVEEVMADCRIGKEIGLEAVIVDDGWQTLDSQRGYAYTGDWQPERIPDMREFVDRIHKLDMKFLLWYSVPFIGEHARNVERFKGKYLRYWDGQGAYVMDTRYPDVREFIINTYEKALEDWNLDGFKLDFIGFFRATDETKMTAEEGRDYASVNEAVDRLMTDIMARLRGMKPDIMVEFRQRYIGPLMRKYGNMFRACDCPNNAVVNRYRTTDLRILSGNTAVHSDMFMWHTDEPVESAALQILNILFSVPQLSVRLVQIPQNHLDMARFWIGYWKANRHVLLDGEFVPVNPGAVYPMLRATKDGKTIVGLYNDMPVVCDDSSVSKIDVLNAKRSEAVVLDVQKDMGAVQMDVYDCLGRVQKTEKKELHRGLYKVNVPSSGLLQIANLR